ncbi:MAG: DUF1446 domain-containing protein [Acetobacteraceae bacterium]|nr:DUF1446 domain-containing protein [Acetobacteraceae bacterium]
MKTIRIGAGAAYSGDRVEPAVELAREGKLDYLVFECLAERTIALAQQARRKDPSRGYDPLLEKRMRAVLALCAAQKIRIITNMGAANPESAAEKTRDIARAMGLTGLKIAAITGDDVLEQVKGSAYRSLDTDEPVKAYDNRMVSANAYLGAQPIVDALAGGADVVIAGRIADPALFLAPLVYEFGWSMTDWTKLGRGTAVGHLLECGGQITGGYFADPGPKDVPSMARLGFPLAEVSEDGTAVITKVPGSGGKVSAATCKEQLLYEVHDPKAYFQPDVVADFSHVRVTEIGPDQVRIEGADGHPRTETLKVTVGYLDGFIGEGEITYAGSNALVRGQLAREIVRERLQLTGAQYDEIRFDLIGMDSLHGEKISANAPEPREVRLRVAARTSSMANAQVIGEEVETLWVNGPAGGGGARKYAREILAVLSVLLPRDRVRHTIRTVES